MIWIIGGTIDAVKIAELLSNAQKRVLVTATTSYGSENAGNECIQVIQKKLETSDMQKLMEDYKVDFVIDASHPFAEKVSQNAIKACRLQNVRYLRFERKSFEFQQAQYYKNYNQMIQYLLQTKGKILLTIGSQNIYRFSVLGTKRLTARVLPQPESINKCINAGLKLQQIIGVKGPMTKETNKALMLEYGIGHLVTKDTGKEGGLLEKATAAKELGILIHILQRPVIEYPEVYDNYNDVISAI